VLDDARKILEKEFIGIDEFIDRVLDSLSNLHLFPQLQERPVIINLWGLTGVGKTAMVLRPAELLEVDKRTFRYHMGNKSDLSPNLKSILYDLFANLEIPSMLPRSRHS
jgi:ATP-dependent Lon protease